MTAVYNQRNIFVIVCLSFPSGRSTFLPAAVKTENGVLFCLFHFIWLGDKTLSKDKTGTFESVIFCRIILSSTWITVTVQLPMTIFRSRGRRLHLQNYVYYFCDITTCRFQVSMCGRNLANGNKEKIFLLAGRCNFLSMRKIKKSAECVCGGVMKTAAVQYLNMTANQMIMCVCRVCSISYIIHMKIVFSSVK